MAVTREATTPQATMTGSADSSAARIADLARRQEQAAVAVPPRRRGALSARERIERLVDQGSFTETGLFVRATREEDTTGPTGDGSSPPPGR
ncbi:hypothetical protein ABT300_24645 [Streptomyces sp. NPDC001027]|uniref:hypothetical protein n=1 Tax=Streptomyces sp. NPDC001027 TaxID=3154771 RepID=UPI00332946C2